MGTFIGISPTLLSTDYKGPPAVMNTWRQVVSNSQAYKQFGNAVTVPLAEAIGKSIIEFLIEQEAEDGKDTAGCPG